MLVVGENGAGKTNLLESLHVGTQGFSPRTRADAQLVRFGENAGRIALKGSRGKAELELELTVAVNEGKRAKLNGAPLRAAEQLRSEVATLVFTPDRLAVVKGGPAVRRAYFDRALGRLAPARAQPSTQYAASLAQRNAALRRASGGFSSRDAVTPWTEQVVSLGRELVEARGEVLAALAPGFADRAGELEVSARTQDVGEARESLPVSFSGDALEIGFNPEFLRDGIDSVQSEEVRLKLISPLRPGLIQGESDDYSYLIMPIRLAG